MHSEPTRTLADPQRATAEELEEALVHFDELDAPSLERLGNHPVHGRHLAVLRGAELWLSQAEPEDLSAPEACPTAEELYDFGRGPGFEALDPAVEARISAHVEGCEACGALVVTLENGPPLPLELVEEERSLPRTERRSAATPRRLHPPHHLFLLTAAASLLLAFFFAPQLFSPGPGDGLPEQPTYRGRSESALLFPRGLLLARGNEADGERARPIFELQAIEGAEAYLVEVFLHEGSAFEEGQRLQSLRSEESTLAGGPLRPGRYTWQAWALVQGLERELGAREFEVRADRELKEHLADLGPSPSAGELIGAVRVLHDEGYEADARELARRLPASRQKDDFLIPPGR